MPDLHRATEPADLNAVFQALRDERRRDMVVRLSRRPMTVSELAAPVGMRLPTAVKHLAILESGGIVISKKSGRIRTYQINPQAFSTIEAWIAQRRSAIEAGFDRLAQAIAELPEGGTP